MSQIRYVIYDICQKKIYFLAFLIQIILVIVLSTHCVVILANTENALSQIGRLYDTSNAYYITQEMNGDIVINATEDSILLEMYEYIKNEPEIYTYTNIREDIKIPQRGATFHKLLLIDSNFRDVFKPKVEFGTFFTNTELKVHNNDASPVILGNAYSNIFQVGDQFSDSEGNVYSVKGILARDQDYVDLSFGEGVISLDDIILVPAIPSDMNQIGSNGTTTYENYIGNTTILTSDLDKIEELREIGANSNAYIYTFNNVAGAANYLVTYSEQSTGVFKFIAILIIIFSVVMVMINTMDFVRKKTKEFAIHIFSGATKIDIVLRIFWQIGLVTIIGFAISVLIYNQIDIMFLVFLGVFGVCMATCLPAIIVLFKTQISDMLRRSE